MNVRQSYREAAVRGASPIELVVRLYEQMIEDLRQVAIAIERNDIERRGNQVKHAILVLGHLQSALDFDRGGKVARDLETFYNSLRGRLMHVQFHPSKRGAAQLITDLLAVRQAWMQVERAEDSSAASAAARKAAPVASFATPDGESDHVRVDWQG